MNRVYAASIILLFMSTGCKIQGDIKMNNSQNQSAQSKVADEINQKILARFSQSDFKPIDGQKIFGPDIGNSHSTYYVTKLTREEVLGIFSEIIEPYVKDLNWADDYGQFHGAFRLKDDPKMMFGLGISFLKMKPENFKDYPEILKNYQTDIVYTHPHIWEE